MTHASGLWAAAAALLAPVAAAAQGCSLALVLALDVSASVDAREYALQTGGLAAALRAPVVANGILATLAEPVAIAAFEWSGDGEQALVLGWTVLDSPERLAQAAARIETQRRVVPPGPTAIGSAIGFAGGLLARGPRCARRVIDISGDGQSNAGPAPQAAAERLGDVTINALVVGGDLIMDHAPYIPGDGVLSGWFARHVIRGPGAFVEVADGYEDFEAAMRRKLIRELGLMIVGTAGPGR